MILTGTRLQGRYLVKKQIGEGGMGAVYIATDERFGSTVAIKETFFSDESFRKAFEREARLLNNLRHPALPRVSDHFSENEGQFLVMEYIEGDDFSAMMEEGKAAFPVEKVADWADQLLDALDYLHSQEIPVVHRDIKPQNLKLTGRGQVILLDFGLAKGNPTDASHQTAAKSLFGYSRNYASLEQMQGTGTDPRSDLYALAATLYHLLTGRPPEDALTRAMSLLSGGPDPLKPAESFNGAIPAGLSLALQRAMDLNAANRPQNAAEMRGMIRDSSALPKEAGANLAHPAFINPTDEKKTEILPQYQTESETALRTRAAAANIQIPIPQPVADASQNLHGEGGKGKTKPAFIIGSLLAGGLLLAGSGASAVYLLKPDIFADRPAAENVNTPKSPEPTAKAPLPANAAIPAGNQNTNAGPLANTLPKPQAANNSPASSAEAAAKKEAAPKAEEKKQEAPPEARPEAKTPDKTPLPAKAATPMIEKRPEIPPMPLPTPPPAAQEPPRRILTPEEVERIKSLPPKKRKQVIEMMRRNGVRPPNQPPPKP